MLTAFLIGLAIYGIWLATQTETREETPEPPGPVETPDPEPPHVPPADPVPATVPEPEPLPEEEPEEEPDDTDPDGIPDCEEDPDAEECAKEPWFDDSECWGCERECTYRAFRVGLGLGTPAERLHDWAAERRRDAVSTGLWTGDPVEIGDYKGDTFDGSAHDPWEFLAGLRREKLDMWRNACENCPERDGAPEYEPPEPGSLDGDPTECTADAGEGSECPF